MKSTCQRKIDRLLNRYRLVSDYFRSRLVVHGFPVHLKIELTNFCNLSCLMCSRGKMARAVGYIERGLYRKIIKWASMNKCEFVYLHFLGESLFHIDIVDFISLARSSGINVGLSTNATELDELMAKNLIASGLDLLVIAVDSPKPEEYEKLRKGASWIQVVENTRRIARLIKKNPGNLRLVVQMTYCDLTERKIDDFLNLWVGLEFGSDRLRLMVKQWDDWAGQMAENRKWNLKTLPHVPVFSRPCILPWRELSFQWDGTAVPCSRVFDHQIVLGNAACDSIDGIWNGKKIKELRSAHIANDTYSIPVCSTCPRQALQAWNFLIHDQLQIRLRHYAYGTKPKMGLS